MANTNENIDAEDDQFDPNDFEEMPDPMEALSTFLATEDGETIATSLASLKDATVLIAKHLEKQNVILVKMLSALNASKCSCAAPASA